MAFFSVQDLFAFSCDKKNAERSVLWSLRLNKKGSAENPVCATNVNPAMLAMSK
jgi:hypothetical protein